MKTTMIQALLCAGIATGAHASELYFQDFATQGAGYTTSTAEFSDGNTDFFTQSDANSWGGSVSYLGADGAFFAGMDIDGEGAGLPVYLTTSTFDISNASNLQFAIDLAEDDDASRNDWDDSDFVHFEYQIDGGAWINIFSAINNGDQFNSPAFVNGVEITDTFSTFAADLNGVTGSTMAIRLVWMLNSGDEDLAIDNILITGETIAVVPLPTAALAGLGMLGLLGASRRIRK